MTAPITVTARDRCGCGEYTCALPDGTSASGMSPLLAVQALIVKAWGGGRYAVQVAGSARQGWVQFEIRPNESEPDFAHEGAPR